MVRHAAVRLTQQDRQINVIMRQRWPELPAELRRTAANIATIRIGVVAYAIILPASIINMAITSTPAQFGAYLLSFNPVMGTLGLIGASIILYQRTVRTAGQFVAAYQEIAPDFEDRIAEKYGTRGLGDLFAPWIKGRAGFLKKIMSRIGDRLIIKP